jgi:predicted dinucleotide-binding enzyme
MTSETIGIIGAGSVGSALGRRLIDSGYAVQFGVRNPAGISELIRELGNAKAGSPAEVASACEILFLAVPGGVAVDVASSLGDTSGKVLVDCANALRWDNGPVWTPPTEGSLSQAIAARCPGLRVVKAFNTFGAEFHENPDLGGDKVEVPMAGDDKDAKERVAAIAERAGFAPVDAGPLRNAAVLENHAILWIHLALAAGHGRDFVFKMVRRS